MARAKKKGTKKKQTPDMTQSTQNENDASVAVPSPVEHDAAAGATLPTGAIRTEDRTSGNFSSARASVEAAATSGVKLGLLRDSLETLAVDMYNVGCTSDENHAIFGCVQSAIDAAVADAAVRVDGLVQEEQTMFASALGETQKLRIAIHGSESASRKLDDTGSATPLPQTSCTLAPVPTETDVTDDCCDGSFIPVSRRTAAPFSARSMRDIRQALLVEKDELSALASQRVEVLATAARAFSVAAADLAEARSAIEADARLHDDVLGATNEASGKVVALPEEITEGDMAGEGLTLCEENVRKGGVSQDLTLDRIERVAAVAARVQQRVDSAAELRVRQQTDLTFGPLYHRIRSAAVASSNVNLPTTLDTICAARRSQLDSRLCRIEKGEGDAVTSEINSCGDQACVVGPESPSIPADFPECVRALYKPAAGTCAARLHAVRAEERFALNLLCRLKAAQLASLVEQHAAQRAAYRKMTNDERFAEPLHLLTNIPERFRESLRGAAAQGGETGEQGSPRSRALSSLHDDALSDITTPAATIMEEVELLDASLEDAMTSITRTAAMIELVATITPCFRRRQVLLADAVKYSAESNRERMLSRKASAATEMIAAAKWKQQMKDSLPGYERNIVDALAAFDRRYPGYQDSHPVKIDGVILRNQSFEALAAAEAEAHAHAASNFPSRQGSVAPAHRNPGPAPPLTPSRPGPRALSQSRGVNAATSGARKGSCTPVGPGTPSRAGLGDKRARSIVPSSPAPRRVGQPAGLPPASKRPPATSRGFAGSQAPPRTPVHGASPAPRRANGPTPSPTALRS